jgi:hypothetical protein
MRDLGADSTMITQAAQMYTALGMQREALEALGRLPAGIYSWQELHDYSYSAIRTDHRFQQLLNRSWPAFLSTQ